MQTGVFCSAVAIIGGRDENISISFPKCLIEVYPMKKLAFLALFGCATMVSVVGCGGSDSPPTSPPSEGELSSHESEGDAAAAAANPKKK